MFFTLKRGVFSREIPRIYKSPSQKDSSDGLFVEWQKENLTSQGCHIKKTRMRHPIVSVHAVRVDCFLLVCLISSERHQG